MVNDYKDLIERLKHGVGIINLERAGILDWSTLQEAADAIEALIAERDAVRALNLALIKNKTKAPEELAALKQKIDSAEPVWWWALVMGASAALEDAANCLRDMDAKKSAEGAAKHYRTEAKNLINRIKE